MKLKKPIKRIRVTQPSITKKEIQLVTKAITNAWGPNAFIYIKQFEDDFSKYIGVKQAIATSSCTGALHIALKTLNIGAGDEVIIPDITWAATAFAVCYVGAKPIFADICSDSWCIDPESIEKRITKKTKAIIPVHLYGHPAEMDKIRSIAKKHHLYVIEDAAESVGALYKGQKTGSMSDFSVFSFHGTKTLTTGEGGILLTNNSELFNKANKIANMGKNSNKMFWIDEIGLKYKMTDMQAALGIAQLSRIDELLNKKRQIYKWYAELLLQNKNFTMNVEKTGCLNSFWMPTVIWNKKFKIHKESVIKQLNSYNIDARPFFYPLSQMEPFKIKIDNPISYDLSKRAINLPCGFDITKREIKYICTVFNNIMLY